MTEVLVTGTFNIVHAGHVRLLEFANRYGLVTVGINADSYVKKKYGDKAVPLVDRSFVLRNNSFVHKVVVFREDNPSGLIRKLKPDFYIRGPDYRDTDLLEQSALDEVQTKVIIQPCEKEYSSTFLLEEKPKRISDRLSKYT